jgi:hypothetical protein
VDGALSTVAQSFFAELTALLREKMGPEIRTKGAKETKAPDADCPYPCSRGFCNAPEIRIAI